MNEKYELLKTVDEYISKLKIGILECSKLFQSGQTSEGSESVITIIEGLQWIIDAIALTSDIQKEPIDSAGINSKLNEIIDAFKNEDYILIGDLFEYEILPMLTDWQEKINKIIIDLN